MQPGHIPVSVGGELLMLEGGKVSRLRGTRFRFGMFPYLYLWHHVRIKNLLLYPLATTSNISIQDLSGPGVPTGTSGPLFFRPSLVGAYRCQRPGKTFIPYWLRPHSRSTGTPLPRLPSLGIVVVLLTHNQ